MHFSNEFSGFEGFEVIFYLLALLVAEKKFITKVSTKKMIPKPENPKTRAKHVVCNRP